MTKKQMRDSMVANLAQNGKDIPVLVDMVDDYIAMWELSKELKKDIKKRGITIQCFSASGVEIVKNNPSAKDLVMVNRQMLAILKELDIKTAVGADDEEL